MQFDVVLRLVGLSIRDNSKRHGPSVDDDKRTARQTGRQACKQEVSKQATHEMEEKKKKEILHFNCSCCAISPQFLLHFISIAIPQEDGQKGGDGREPGLGIAFLKKEELSI